MITGIFSCSYCIVIFTLHQDVISIVQIQNRLFFNEVETDFFQWLYFLHQIDFRFLSLTGVDILEALLFSEEIIWAPSWEKLFLPYANNKGTHQPAHILPLVSVYSQFQGSSQLLKLSRPVQVSPGRKPRRQVFSLRGSFWKFCRLS